ncbi:MAG: hypothetical protein VX768_08390 [Planctomycetota bacterium]|nr:hypothetical protein [Planctomycetota bacterium]
MEIGERMMVALHQNPKDPILSGVPAHLGASELRSEVGPGIINQPQGVRNGLPFLTRFKPGIDGLDLRIVVKGEKTHKMVESD